MSQYELTEVERRQALTRALALRAKLLARHRNTLSAPLSDAQAERDHGDGEALQGSAQGDTAGERCPHCGGAPRDVYGTSLVACTDCGRYLGQQR